MTSTLEAPPTPMTPVRIACAFGRVSTGKDRLSVSMTFGRGAFECNGQAVVDYADQMLTNRRLNLKLTNQIPQEGDLFAELDGADEIELDAIVETNALSLKTSAISITGNINRNEMTKVQRDQLMELAQSSGSIVLLDSQNKQPKKLTEPGGEDQTSGAGTYLANVIDGKGLVLTAAQVATLTTGGFPTSKSRVFGWFGKHADNEHENSEIKALTRFKGLSIARAERLREAVLTERTSTREVINADECMRNQITDSGEVSCDILLKQVGSRKWLWGIDFSIGKEFFGFSPVNEVGHEDYRLETSKAKAKAAALTELTSWMKRAVTESDCTEYRTDVNKCLKALK